MYPMHFKFTEKYCLVDSVYKNLSGFLPPYKGRQADISDRRQEGFRSAKELFNFRHLQLCNVIERCFEVLKRRFVILRSVVSNYMVTT